MKLLFSLLICFSCLSEVTEFKVEVKPKLEITSAIGLIVSPQETIQIPETTISANGQFAVISFKADLKDNTDILYSAVVSSETGELQTIPLKPYFPNNILDSEIPICQEVISENLRNDISMVDKLISIREKRLENRKAIINVNLTPELIEKITKYENNAGFEYAANLSPETPAEELGLRLERITEIIKSFNRNKKK